MITDKDIIKLKTIFATKDDLKWFATKEDLKLFATKEDLKAFSTKEDMSEMRKDYTETFHTVIEMIGDISVKLDAVLVAIKDNKDGLNDHERRLDRLEDQVFPN